MKYTNQIFNGTMSIAIVTAIVIIFLNLYFTLVSVQYSERTLAAQNDLQKIRDEIIVFSDYSNIFAKHDMNDVSHIVVVDKVKVSTDKNIARSQ